MSVQGLALQSENDFTIFYGREAEEEIQRLQMQIEKTPSVRSKFPSRWLAIELLEKDWEVREKLQVLEGGKKLLDEAVKSITRLEELYGDDTDVIIADHRYGWIHGLVREAVKQKALDRLTTTDKIDKIVTNRWLGIPIFLAAMWLVFKLTVDVSAPYLDWVDGVINGPITNWVAALLGALNLGGTWVESLLIDGVIAGVGGVLVFVPVLMFLYLALAILEDSGYMARAAFVMDRLMQTIGLHGKSFLPMLVGFGCTVPALYATRTLENEKDRILTGLLVPFMSCAARLPVYVLFAAIFFPSHAGAVIFSMYLIGIITAIILGILLKKSVFRSKEQSTFVIELPPYRMPTLRSIWFHMWERTGSFIRKAWTVILATSVLLWILMAIPVGGEGDFSETNIDSSLFATVSGVIAPAFKPLGFGTWEATGSLMTGFVAKEVVISSMSQIYGAEAEEQEAVPTTFLEDVGEIIKSFINATVDTIKSLFSIVGINLFEEQAEEEPSALMESIRGSFEASSGGHGALAGLAFIVFVLIYTPCMVAIAAERQELGAKWMWISIFGQLALAWLLAVIVFQSGKLLGLG
jgi:ferrous iron transport protein B